jgi:SAM-dependent methyltransferase
MGDAALNYEIKTGCFGRTLTDDPGRFVPTRMSSHISISSHEHSQRPKVRPTDDELMWYASWRPRIWAPVIGNVFDRFGWDQLRGKRVLEVGYFDGRMGVLMARLGCLYVGCEITAPYKALAELTALKARVADQTDFRIGDFMELTEREYDVIFMKSILWRINSKETYIKWLNKICSVLKPGGKLIAIENCHGLYLNRLYRRWFRKDGATYVNNQLYCSDNEVLFRNLFKQVDVRYHYFLAHLTPWPSVFTCLEQGPFRPKADNCFIASLICTV